MAKNLGGRPPKYKNGEELQKKIDEYFEQCNPVFISGVMVKRGNPTITGLALYLGFLDRNSIYDYARDGRYSRIIKRATARVAQSYEELLTSGDLKATGPIFALKNMGWSDNREIRHEGEIKHTHTLPPAALDLLKAIKHDDEA